MNNFAQWVGNWLRGLGSISMLAFEVVRALGTLRSAGREFLNQLYFIGVKSQSVVLITGAFTGMVLEAQTYFQFVKVKMESATLAVVGVSMCGELGPVLTALMVAGRVGAAMAAQIGTMKVTEQIDALRTLATHPVDYLVVPRVVATLVAMPLLTAEAIAVGIGAAFLVGTFLLQVEPSFSWWNLVRRTDVTDVIMGLTKAGIFGGAIALISCQKGLHCGEGAEGVGRATTEAVVYASITILVSNFFLTLLLTKLLAML